MRWWIVGCVSGIVTAAVPVDGRAQGSSGSTTEAASAAESGSAEVSEENREEARQAYRRGRRLLERNRPEDALEEFGRSYALYPHWATSNSMGVCHDRLGRPDNALRLYQQALREGGEEIPGDQREELEQRIETLRIQLGIRDPTTGTIRVSSQPAGARVLLDRVDSGFTPTELEVAPGPHRIDVELDGYQPNGREVEVVAGEAVQVALALEIVVIPTGVLVCNSEPSGLRVYVDGADVGRTPATLPSVPEGEHVVRFETADGQILEETVNVPADGTARVSASLSSGLHQGWFWSTAGLALALGAGAAGTGAYGTILWNEFNDETTTRDRQEEIQPLGQDLMLSTDVLASAAGACAVAALVLALFTDFGGEQASIDIGYEGPSAPPVDFPADAVEPAEGDEAPAEGGGEIAADVAAAP